MQKKTRENDIERNLSLRSRLGRTFNRIILRKSEPINNSSLKSKSVTNLPPIGTKQQDTTEQVRI